MTQFMPIVRGETLIYQQCGQDVQLTVGTPAWSDWLSTAARFAFESEFGTFTARCEQAGNKRGGWYWRAYRKFHGKLHRIYIGKSEELTLERLRTVAAALVRQSDDEDGSQVLAPEVNALHRLSDARSTPDRSPPETVSAPDQSATAGYLSEGITSPPSSDLRKMIGPLLSPTILHRPSLVAALNEAVSGPSTGGTSLYKLVLLCAPAGYGKTTLLADFAQHTALPCCWYVLDRADADKIKFLELLLASIRQCFPRFGATLDAELANAIAADTNGSLMPDRLGTLIDALAAAIAAEIAERFALILCNYHEINHSQVINQLVSRLIGRLPPRCMLILESRAAPALELAPLLARREVFGLGSNELRFTAQEIRALAQLQGVDALSEAEALHLAQAFDGWITGILLSTRLGDLRSPGFSASFGSGWGSPALRMDRQQLLTYLVNEVFSREPDAYVFLQEAAVLEQMTPSLCNALLTIPDAADHLAYLEQHGLFVIRRGDGSQVSYTCHPILRDLLCDQLRQQSPERFVALHRRAATLFGASHDYEQAIHHALQASAEDTAAGLIMAAYQHMFAHGYTETLARWIDALSETTTAHHPQLLLIRARLYLLLGEHTQALPLLDVASTVLTGQPPGMDPDDLPRVQAELALLRSRALFQQGAYQEAQARCQQVLIHLPADEVALREEAYMRLGVCTCLLGEVASGITHLQQALHLGGQHGITRQVADVHRALTAAYSLLGNFALAEHHGARALSYDEQLNDARGKVSTLILKGLLKQYKGVFAEAAAILTQALTIARQIGYTRGEAYVLVNLGELYQEQGRYGESLRVTEEGLALARHMKDTYLINVTLCVLAMTYLLMGDAQTALLLISQIEQEVTSNEPSRTYESMVRELTLGTIFLHQRRYSEAHIHLTAVEAALHATGLKREHLQVTIRLAACLLAQGETPAAIHHVETAVALARQSGYERLCLLELRRVPNLLHALQSMPGTARLYALVSEEAAAVETANADGASATPIVTMRDRSTLRVLALGEPAVFLDNVLVTHWRMARAMELFFFLLNAGRPMHKEQIITALWPDVDEQTDQTLRSTLYYLRRVLGASCVTSQAGVYLLDLAAIYGERIRYDVTAFQEHYATAQAALTRGDAAAAGTAFQKMTRLYRGDYAQSFYSDWCTSRRHELRQAYLDAHHQLALIAWRHHRLEESVFHWQHLLAVDTCLEEAHYGLIRCYLQQGKRGLALRQHQRCVDALRDDLAVAPGPAMQRLYQRLVDSSSTEPGP